VAVGGGKSKRGLGLGEMEKFIFIGIKRRKKYIGGVSY